MYRKFTCSIYTRFGRISPSKRIHTVRELETKSFSLSFNLEKALADQFVSILRNCSGRSSFKQGQQIHAQSIVNGLISNNGLLGANILGMYVLCGSLIDARNLFYKLNLKYASPWNWIIRGFTMMGRFEFAVLFYFKMLANGTCPDKYTFPHVIKACGCLGNVSLAKFVHNSILEMGFEEDEFVGSSLIKVYADRGLINDARRLFDNMSQRDIVLWNVMLNGYVKNGELSSAIQIFLDLRYSESKPNSVTFVCALSLCASEAMIKFGSQLHGLVVKYGLETDSSVANTLLAAYSKSAQLVDAHKLFDMMPKTDVVTWNSIIGGYVQNGFMAHASNLFHEMISAGIKPDAITFSSFLPSISESEDPMRSREIHGYIIRHCIPFDIFLKSALIDVYFKCRDFGMASNVFTQSTTVDIVVCTAMISGYVLNGMNNDALEIFRWLLQKDMVPNSITLASVLPACSALAALKLGKELHGYILKMGLEQTCYVGSAISDMYAKCGRLDLAYHIFSRMSERDAVSWNSIITSCSQNGRPEEAIYLFHQMGMDGMKYDAVSISAALSACANLPTLCYGKEIHGFIIRNALISDIFAESALIDMYSKCGSLVSACRVFDMMESKSEVSWNNIISAYGSHGQLRESLSLFHEMLESGVQPDHVTFLAIISACGHAGEVDTGLHYFRCMTEEFGIPARMEHYSCMVDLLGRVGLLSEAFQTIESMPFIPDAGIWGTLLGACRVHGNVELAEVASKYLLDLDPQNSGYYILLSHIHADAGQWGGVLKVRNLMTVRGVNKVPGYSWIEVNNATHMFVAADGSHPQSEQIYAVLESLLPELRIEGYVPQIYLPVHPQTLRFSSEKQV